MQQLVDGQHHAFGAQPYQMHTGLPVPSSYSYRPNSKPAKRDSIQTGLDQTLTSHSVASSYPTTPLYQDPQSSISAPGAVDYSYGGFDMLNGDYALDNDNSTSRYVFDADFGSAGLTGHTNNSGQVTPAATEGQWNPDDFFTFGPDMPT
jgi:hypothetical protein